MNLRPMLPLAALALVGASSPSGADALKCAQAFTMPGFERGQPLVMIDGEVHSDLSELDPDDVESIEILCWNPETGEFEAPGMPLAYVVTREGAEAAGRDQPLQAGLQALKETAKKKLCELWLRGRELA